MTMSKIPRHIWNGPTHETEDAPSPDAVPSDPYPSSHQICDLEPQKGQLLIVSPYTSPPHLLALSTLNDAQQLLAHALTNLEATHTGYATASYTSSFNWSTVISILRNLATSQEYTWQHQHFYIVVFRSRIPPTTDRIHLGGLDRYAHAEAMKSGGLLKYWFGVPDAEGRNLATCVWRKHEDARPGSIGPGHKAAMRATINLYTEWRIERLKLTITDNVEGWSIDEWTD